jgi:hypothetical protein
MNDEKRKRSRKNYVAARKSRGIAKRTAEKTVTSLKKNPRKHTVVYVRYTPQGFIPVTLVYVEGSDGLNMFKYRDLPIAADSYLQCPICLQTTAVSCGESCLEIKAVAKTVADNMCEVGESVILSLCPSVNIGPTAYAMKLHGICARE